MIISTGLSDIKLLKTIDKIVSQIWKKNKFKVNFILDKATNFSNNSKLINGKKKNKRNIYICLAIKE